MEHETFMPTLFLCERTKGRNTTEKMVKRDYELNQPVQWFYLPCLQKQKAPSKMIYSPSNWSKSFIHNNVVLYVCSCVVVGSFVPQMMQWLIDQLLLMCYTTIDYCVCNRNREVIFQSWQALVNRTRDFEKRKPKPENRKEEYRNRYARNDINDLETL